MNEQANKRTNERSNCNYIFSLVRCWARPPFLPGGGLRLPRTRPRRRRSTTTTTTMSDGDENSVVSTTSVSSSSSKGCNNNFSNNNSSSNINNSFCEENEFCILFCFLLFSLAGSKFLTMKITNLCEISFLVSFLFVCDWLVSQNVFFIVYIILE